MFFLQPHLEKNHHNRHIDLTLLSLGITYVFTLSLNDDDTLRSICIDFSFPTNDARPAQSLVIDDDGVKTQLY